MWYINSVNSYRQGLRQHRFRIIYAKPSRQTCLSYDNL